MPKIHVKSDFDFILSLMVQCADGVLRELAFPNCSFKVQLSTNPSYPTDTFIAYNDVPLPELEDVDMDEEEESSSTNEEEVVNSPNDTDEEDAPNEASLVNCFEDEGRLHIVVDGNPFERGNIYCQFSVDIPDPIYPDMVKTVTSLQKLDIEIVSMDSEDMDTFTVPLYLPQAFEHMSDTILAEGEHEDVDNDYTQAIVNAYNDAHESIAEALRSIGLIVDPNASFVSMAHMILNLEPPKE